MTDYLDAWSFSRWWTAQACPRQAALAYLERRPLPPRPVLPEGVEYPDDRGKRLHAQVAAFIESQGTLAPEIESITEALTPWRKAWREGAVAVETAWGFDQDWRPCAPHAFETWLRMRLDAWWQESPTTGTVLEIKTGRRPNRVREARQGELYAVGASARIPTLTTVRVVIWHIPRPRAVVHHFDAAQLADLRAQFTRIGQALTTQTDWPATPSHDACRFCPYKTGWINTGVAKIPGTGDCADNPLSFDEQAMWTLNQTAGESAG